MHVVKSYQASKNKQMFLDKFKPIIRELIIEIDRIINLIDSEIDPSLLTEYEVNKFGEILEKMYSADIEYEAESMVTAYEKMSALKVRIWKRNLKKL